MKLIKTKEENIEDYIRYKGGKVVLDDKSGKKDQAFYKSFKTCEGRELFLGAN